MQIGDWKASRELNEVYLEARALGLETNIAELEAYGFTVVEPEQVRAGDLCARMMDATVSVCDEMDAEGAKFSRLRGANGGYVRMLHGLVTRSPVFAEAAMHPVALTLGRYLMGASCRLFSVSSFVKRGTATPTVLHADSQGTPPPLYPFGLTCNISWILTDYTEDNGTFAMVPGSHRYCRHPTPTEQPKFMGGSNEEICVPVVAKPGSMIVFNGNTWHGTYPKQNDDIRVHVAVAYCRNYLMPAENFEDVPPAYLEKYGDAFSHLLARDTWQGYKSEGPKGQRVEALNRANYTPSA